MLRRGSHQVLTVPGIRNFVVQFILQCSSSEESLKSSKTLLNKLNLVLISVLKQEWPHNWPTFINEIITACHTGLSICENNMIILRLLSEEVFDYSAEQMTSAKTRNLKSTMCAEFSQIFQLCTEILNTATQPSLVNATLETLLRFCNWIPLGYIFETPLIHTLRSRFLSVPEFRNVTLQCLTEIGGLQTSSPGQVTNYNEQLVKMFTETLSTISDIIPIQMDLQNTYPTSNSKDQEFVQNLALFLCNFFSMHLNVRRPCPSRSVLVLTGTFSWSRTYQTGTSSRTATSTWSAFPRSTTARSSRSAWTTGSSSYRSSTTRCRSCPSPKRTPSWPWGA